MVDARWIPDEAKLLKPDSRVEKWNAWIEKQIDFLAGTYGATRAIAVRRQAEVDPRVISLAALLNDCERRRA